MQVRWRDYGVYEGQVYAFALKLDPIQSKSVRWGIDRSRKLCRVVQALSAEVRRYSLRNRADEAWVARPLRWPRWDHRTRRHKRVLNLVCRIEALRKRSHLGHFAHYRKQPRPVVHFKSRLHIAGPDVRRWWHARCMPRRPGNSS